MTMLDAPQATERYTVGTCTDSDEWNQFVEHNDGPAYNHWAWSDAVASYGHPRWHLVARDNETDEIAAALPIYHVESRLFGSKLLSPAFAERGGIVIDETAQAETAKRLILEQTKRMAAELDAEYVSLRGAQATDAADFSVKNRYVTFQVSTDQGSDAVWDDIRDSRQRQIRQADDNDALQFKVADSLADLETYYQLYLETMHRHGSPAHSFEFFRTLWDQLHEPGHLRLSLILHEGSPINGMIDLSLGSTVYQWGVVNEYEHRDLNGGSLLLWKSLERAAEDGFDTYEFGRTREGSGVYLFKKSFGGTKTWYDDVHYFPNGEVALPDPEAEKYERAKEIWKRLPLSVTRIVGPQVRKQLGI
ncbi:GNAT family N-acetyltransferase [Haloarcula salinisoli]|uniref:GNAT family N-acetyltransferase n=1 Tax=Haloarcula salinisoli TaxID=2487746 RepID=A0A8J7YHV2_9EURY|nr:GNAT family N-acetyltransferase [Halomicroarcula salinisoli]MBX0305827.1 GNAT family N-acetyltransferase [Halomicroarcula salinisoli]